MRELHRELARGPLARVVQAHVEVDGPAVVGAVHVGGDLHPLDRAAVDRLSEDHGADEARVVVGERLELGRVVGVVAVRVAAARESGAAAALRRQLLGATVGGVRGFEVGDQRPRLEPGGGEQCPVGVGMEDDRGRADRYVLGDIDPELLETRQVRRAGDRYRGERGRPGRGAGRAICRKSSDSGTAATPPARRHAWIVNRSPADTHALASSSDVTEVEAATARGSPSRKIARSQSGAPPPSRRTVSRPSAGAVHRRSRPRGRNPVTRLVAQSRATATPTVTAPAPGAATTRTQAESASAPQQVHERLTQATLPAQGPGRGAAQSAFEPAEHRQQHAPDDEDPERAGDHDP